MEQPARPGYTGRGNGEAVSTRDAIIHRIPVRGFDIELRLPRDLTSEEAARVSRLLGALVCPSALREGQEGKVPASDSASGATPPGGGERP